MRKPESIPENELHKILWDFQIQTNHLIPARRPDQMIIKKTKNKNKQTSKQTKRELAVQVDHRVKIKESDKRDKW